MEETNRILKGVAASPGVAVGRAFLLDREDFYIPLRYLSPDEAEADIILFQKAIEEVKEEIASLQQSLAQELKGAYGDIFTVHLMLMNDPHFTGPIIERTREERVNIEYVCSQEVLRAQSIFSKMKDQYLRERFADIRDVMRRIIRKLMKKERVGLADITQEVIIIAHDLSPSDTAQMMKGQVLAFATDVGGPTSHTAIMARALEIPAVVALQNISRWVRNDDLLIVDGHHGLVILNPDEETLQQYLNIKAKDLLIERELVTLRDLPALTTDGIRVLLSANLDLPQEVPSLMAHGAEGVGLFRTEFLYMNRSDLPSEEEQFQAFHSVIEKMGPSPVIIRTLDVGGDKLLSQLDLPQEMNPYMGCRAIRLCLERPELFKAQLRAILRASAHGYVKVMYPMVSCIEELKQANAALEEAKRELYREGIPYDPHIEKGLVIEVPSSAFIADILAKEVDFFSVGTNDLIQYSMAVDRVNERVAHLYDPSHLAVLRMIKMTVETAQKANIMVGMCGEMAGDPLFTIVLIGLGLRELSTVPQALPGIKKIIRSVSIAEAQEVTQKVLQLSTAHEIREELRKALKRVVPSMVEEGFYETMENIFTVKEGVKVFPNR